MVQYEPLVIKIYKCIENVKTRWDNNKTYHCHCHCHCNSNADSNNNGNDNCDGKNNNNGNDNDNNNDEDVDDDDDDVDDYTVLASYWHNILLATQVHLFIT